MRYRLWFRDCAGNPLTMNGFKDVGDDAGLDMWKDTTSLFVNLLTGHVEEPPRQPDGRPVPDDPASSGPGASSSSGPGTSPASSPRSAGHPGASPASAECS